MPWLSASVVVETALVEPLSDALIEEGALSVDVADADAGTAWERAIFDEPDSAASAGWARGRVSALFSLEADVPGAVEAAFERAHVAAGSTYALERIEDEDWVCRTQAQFTPQRVTERLWVVPSWHTPPDPHALSIVLDPGLAFGTGTHPTTRLCLQWLERTLLGGESVIDFGCGSGILAIAALKLGAARASGVDIDSQAVTAARRNALQNDVRATFVPAAEELDEPAQVLVANILAQPLVVLAPLLARLTLEGGRIALSGILAEQAGEVQDAYRPWYDFEPLQHDGGWVLIAGTRRHIGTEMAGTLHLARGTGGGR